MPIIELVLFGVGVGFGGKTAWEKFKSDFDKGDSSPAPPSTPVNSPMTSPRGTARGASSPRSESGPPPGVATLPLDKLKSGKENGSDNGNTNGAIEGVSGRKGDEATPQKYGTVKDFHEILVNSLNILSPRKDATDDEPSPSKPTVQDVSPLNSPRKDDGADGMKDQPWMNRLVALLDGRNSQEPSKDELQYRLREAVRTMAGDSYKPSSQTPKSPGSPRASVDWSPAMTPRLSALKKDWGDIPSPRGSPGSDKRRVKFETSREKLFQIHRYEYEADELDSRRRRWAEILRAVEREAYEAYLSHGKHRNRVPVHSGYDSSESSDEEGVTPRGSQLSPSAPHVHGSDLFGSPRSSAKQPPLRNSMESTLAAWNEGLRGWNQELREKFGFNASAQKAGEEALHRSTSNPSSPRTQSPENSSGDRPAQRPISWPAWFSSSPRAAGDNPAMPETARSTKESASRPISNTPVSPPTTPSRTSSLGSEGSEGFKNYRLKSP